MSYHHLEAARRQLILTLVWQEASIISKRLGAEERVSLTFCHENDEFEVEWAACSQQSNQSTTYRFNWKGELQAVFQNQEGAQDYLFEKDHDGVARHAYEVELTRILGRFEQN